MKNNDLDSLKWEVNRHQHGHWLWPHGPEDHGGDRPGGGKWPLLLLLALLAALWVLR